MYLHLVFLKTRLAFLLFLSSQYLPGSLKPFEKDISQIFRLEKAKLIHNQHFKNIFAKIDIKPVFMNKSNLKNQWSEQKLLNQECIELQTLPHTQCTLSRRLIAWCKIQEIINESSNKQTKKVVVRPCYVFEAYIVAYYHSGNT